jgi:hypothetical protein
LIGAAAPVDYIQLASPREIWPERTAIAASLRTDAAVRPDCVTPMKPVPPLLMCTGIKAPAFTSAAEAVDTKADANSGAFAPSPCAACAPKEAKSDRAEAARMREVVFMAGVLVVG